MTPRSLALLVAVAAALGLAPTARAAMPYEVPVIIELTGGGSFSGKGVAAQLEALQDNVNKAGGIAGRPLHFSFHDDQSSPQVAVQLAGAIVAKRPAIVLSSVLVAMCNAVAPLMKGGPVLYCLSPAFHPAAGSHTFSANTATDYQFLALMRYFRLKGWTKIAVLNGTDATGQNADKAVVHALANPENAGMKLVEHEHFALTDVSVAAQMARINSSGAQTMIAWTTGAAAATVFKGMIQAALDIPIATSAGNETFAQMEQYAEFLPKRLIIPSALYPEHRGLLSLDPRVEQAQADMVATLQAHGLRPDVATGDAWDPGLILVAALRKLGPGATPAQIGDFIAHLTDFPGVNGLYDFKKYPDRGLGPESATLVTYDPKAKNWMWLSQPGGTPLH